MKSVLSTVLIAGIVALNASADEKKVDTAQPAAETSAAPKLDKEKISYAIGMYFGNTIKRQAVDVDLDTVAKGIKDVVSGTPTMTEPEAQQTLQAMQAELRAKHEAEAKALGEKNKAEGEKFLAENAKKPGVHTTADGLQYKIIKEGNGPKPTASDKVTTQYRGTLINGTEFDSSYKRGQPAEFPVTGVIPGWTEALQMMPVGSKWELYIPSELAYGERGAGRDIGPNATLIFEIELLGIKPPETHQPNQAVSGEIIKVPSAEELKKGAKIEVIRPDQTNTANPKK